MHPAFRFARENYIARMEALLLRMRRLLAEEEENWPHRGVVLH
jgi:hypothetical protein